MLLAAPPTPAARELEEERTTKKWFDLAISSGPSLIHNRLAPSTHDGVGELGEAVQAHGGEK
jgi:hypothetical protein